MNAKSVQIIALRNRIAPQKCVFEGVDDDINESKQESVNEGSWRSSSPLQPKSEVVESD